MLTASGIKTTSTPGRSVPLRIHAPSKHRHPLEVARDAHRRGLAQRGGPLTASIASGPSNPQDGDAKLDVQWITKHESKAGVFGRAPEPRWQRRLRSQDAKSSLRRARRAKVRVLASAVA